MRKGLNRKFTAIFLWAMAAYYGALALALYTWPDSYGSYLLAVAVISWLSALVFFLRIPSEG